MGDYYQSIVAPDVPEADAPLRLAALKAWLLSERIMIEGADRDGNSELQPGPEWSAATDPPGKYSPFDFGWNTVDLCSTRNVFYADGVEELSCPGCGTPYLTTSANWSNAVDAWYRGQDDYTLRCDACQRSSDIRTWRFDPTWAFGSLGLTFWNWPQLSEAFRDEVGRRTTSRAVIVRGKL